MESEDARFVFSFTHESRDYSAMVSAMTRRSVKQRIVRGLILCMSALAAANWLRHETGSSLVGAFVLLLPVLIILPLITFGHRVNGVVAKLAFRNTVYAGQAATTTFTDTGLRTTCAGIAAELEWQSVRQIIETAEYAFLAVSKRDAITIPRRAARSGEEFDKAIAFARRKIRTDER